MNLLVTDGSSSQISDHIKDVLFAKSAENIETIRPNVAASIFDGDINLDSQEVARKNLNLMLRLVLNQKQKNNK